MALVAVALVAFAVVLLAHRRAPFLTIRTVAALSGVLLAVAVVVPSRQSKDLFAYAAYGRIVSHYHDSPYKVRPADLPAGDPIVRAMAPGWRPVKSVYGPVFTAVSAAGMAVAGDSVLGARLFFQLLAALAVAACLVLIWRRTRDPAAVALVGLNPVIALAVVNGGHNDILVGLALLAAVALSSNERLVSAGLVLALGTLVKVIAVLPLGALVLYLLVRRGWRVAAVTAGPAAALIAVSYGLAGGLTAVRPIREGAVNESRASIWGAVLRIASGIHPHISASPSVIQQVQIVAAIVVGAVALVTVLGRLGDADPALVTGTAVVAYLLAAAYVLPWYAGWALPVLALAWRSRLSLLAAAHAGLLLLAYEDVPTFRHADLLHRLMHGFWAYALPSLETVALVGLVVVAITRMRQVRAA